MFIILNLSNEVYIFRYKLEMVYRKQKTVISGGFLAGDLNTINRFHVFFHKVFMQLLDNRKIDDDQVNILFNLHCFYLNFCLFYQIFKNFSRNTKIFKKTQKIKKKIYFQYFSYKKIKIF